MAEKRVELFEQLAAGRAAEASAPAKGWTAGLSNLGPQVAAELSRLGTQGSMELASALFGGSGFVPYGPGQYTPAVEGLGADPHGVPALGVGSPEGNVFGMRDVLAAAPSVPESPAHEQSRAELSRQEMSRGR